MRTLCAAGLWITLLTATTPALAETTFPYKATINGSDVYVRSGPGKNYYPTDKLQRGTEVEVYRHDPGGWCAIRPPADSFSWVPGKHLRFGKGDIAEIISDKAVAYVGSRFRDVHDVRQVQLDRGEAVQVVGEKRFTSEGENIAQTWYKIMPPAGEFRWVYGKLLLKQQGGESVARSSASRGEEPAPIENELAEAVASSTDEPAAIDIEPEAVAIGSVADDNRTDADTSANDYEPELAVAEAEPATYEQESAQGTTAGRATTAGSETPIRIADNAQATEVSSAPSKRKRTRNDLDIELSMIVAEEPDNWDFTNLRSQAKKQLQESESALDRGRARVVLREIKRYEAIQEEYFEAEELRQETDRKNEEIENSVRPASAELEIEAEEAEAVDRFDGIGRLTPVRSKRVGAPPYALTDGEGRVLMFVTPAAGIQLQNYVGEVVGMSGIRSYLPKLKTRHLTAKRAELVDDTTNQ